WPKRWYPVVEKPSGRFAAQTQAGPWTAFANTSNRPCRLRSSADDAKVRSRSVSVHSVDAFALCSDFRREILGHLVVLSDRRECFLSEGLQLRVRARLRLVTQKLLHLLVAGELRFDVRSVEIGTRFCGQHVKFCLLL